MTIFKDVSGVVLEAYLAEEALWRVLTEEGEDDTTVLARMDELWLQMDEKDIAYLNNRPLAGHLEAKRPNK